MSNIYLKHCNAMEDFIEEYPVEFQNFFFRGVMLFMFNQTILVGRITADPEIRYTQGGKQVANLTVAVTRPKYGESKEITDFIPVVYWGKIAEVCKNYLNKGSMILVGGKIQTRSYTAKDGSNRKVFEIYGTDLRMLSPKSSNNEESLRPSRSEEDIDHLGMNDIGISDDIPF